MRVLLSGVFDIFHYGHMLLIQKCQKLYPDATLIIGVHPDEECIRFKRKPIFSLQERIKTLRIFSPTSIVLECPLLETKKFYKQHRIDITIHAHSRKDNDYYIKNCYREDHEMRILKRLDYTSSISTTDIINRIKKSP